MRKITFISSFLILANFCFAWQVKLIKTISLERDALFVGFFVVLGDGSFIFTDTKDKHSQFKIFNEEGRLVKSWGKMGPGPDEFGGLSFPDYQRPYLAVADAGKRQIHIFENLGNYKFKKIGSFLAWELSAGLKIYKKNVLMVGYIVSPQGKEYILFMRDFSGKETKYILPLEYRFGAKSMGEHKKISDKVSGISVISFFDTYGDTVYHVSDVRLKIAKIDMRTGEITIIGKKPRNFRPVAMNRKTSRALLTGKVRVDDIVSQHSFVSGLFADKDFVGVLYVNKEKKINHELYFVPYLQLYDHSGKLLHEQRLNPFYSEERTIPLFYQKSKRHLYLCSMVSGEETLSYVIYKFSIEP